MNAQLEENRRLREESIQREHAERFQAKEEPAAEEEGAEEEEVVYQKKPKRKRRVVVVQDSSSEEEIEVKLPKQKKSGADGNDDVYRRAYQRMLCILQAHRTASTLTCKNANYFVSAVKYPEPSRSNIANARRK